jgi:hypothetical protein
MRRALADAAANDYTSPMDSVRFGRALGIGARGAAKALATAADAAASPNPRPAGTARQPAREPSRSVETLGQKAARTTAQVRQTKEGLSRGGKRFGEAMWGPFVKLSGVLWLELTGVFFGLFVVTALLNTWKLRANFHDTGINHTDHQHLLFSIAMAAVFGYFCLSSFVRASRRQHRKK